MIDNTKMTATEARRISDLKKLHGLDDVMSKIEAAARDGKYVCYLYESLSSPVQEHLRSMGYKVDSTFAKNEILVKISW